MKQFLQPFSIKKNILLLSCISTLLTHISCGENSGKLEKGTPIAFSQTEIKAMMEKFEENEGKRFSVEGYLTYSPGSTIYSNRMQTVMVKQDINSRDDQNQFAISMPYDKDGKNSVFLPQETGNEEAIFYDNEGKPLTSKDKVMVSFSITKTDNFPTNIRLDKAQ